jgi:hypothetical protein
MYSILTNNEKVNFFIGIIMEELLTALKKTGYYVESYTLRDVIANVAQDNQYSPSETLPILKKYQSAYGHRTIKEIANMSRR